jgi:hypothetical protein
METLLLLYGIIFCCFRWYLRGHPYELTEGRRCDFSVYDTTISLEVHSKAKTENSIVILWYLCDS